MVFFRSRSAKRFVALSLALVVVVGAGLFVWVQSSLPRKSGEIRATQLAATAEIVRDVQGVPYIFAENQRDAAFALGVAHAQDRLWQMELQRRLGAGRLSEILGSRTLSVDRNMRTMGFYRHAEASVAGLSHELQDLFHAYAAGVNSWIRERPGALPPEFLLLRHTPEPWRPADSLVWAKLMGERLSGNFRDELLRARLRSDLSDDEIDGLWPAYPSDAPLTGGDRASLIPDRALNTLIVENPATHVTSEASNAWVVHGARTATGKPILANDPHLRFGAPILWYLATVETPDHSITGATVPGLPVFLLGHNGHVAWGLTATQADLQDVFVERLDPADPERYLTPTGSQPFVTRRELIKVRGSDDVPLNVRSTRHGPVISGIFGMPPGFSGSGMHVAVLAATYLTDSDTSAEAIFRMNRAKNTAGFRNALKLLHTPVLNVFFADTEGEIGFVAAGHVPIRARGQGYLPSAGWDGAHDWQGPLAFDDLPQATNPTQGYIASANNPVVARNPADFISRDWAAPYRARRIEQRLKNFMAHDLQSSTDLQMDSVSAMAIELLPVLLEHASSSDPHVTEAVALLAKWDRKMDRRRPEPAIFNAWMRALNKALYADELGASFAGFWGLRPRLVRNILKNRRSWCNDLRTAAEESCEIVVTESLGRALNELDKKFPGRVMADWRWGDLHQARFENPVLRGVKFISGLSTLEIPTDGGGYTVNRGTMRVRNGARPFSHIHGAGFRAVYDLSNLAASRFTIATGQSGIFFSPHYDNFLERWRDGGFVRLDQSRRQLAATAKSIYTLRPK